ncbi:hypothetical protein EON62_00910 [archaeon]|nr:MAG: hypothetical protein EON62_00910 [archaeon]
MCPACAASLSTCVRATRSHACASSRSILAHSPLRTPRAYALCRELAGSVLDARKAVECVHLLREGCLFMHQEGAFNAFIHTLKAVHAPLDAAQLGSLFWQALRDKGVTLIVSEESGGAVATTHDEARAFLLDARVAPAAPPAPPAPPMALPSFADLEDIE